MPNEYGWRKERVFGKGHPSLGLFQQEAKAGLKVPKPNLNQCLYECLGVVVPILDEHPSICMIPAVQSIIRLKLVGLWLSLPVLTSDILTRAHLPFCLGVPSMRVSVVRFDIGPKWAAGHGPPFANKQQRRSLDDALPTSSAAFAERENVTFPDNRCQTKPNNSIWTI